MFCEICHDIGIKTMSRPSIVIIIVCQNQYKSQRKLSANVYGFREHFNYYFYNILGSFT